MIRPYYFDNFSILAEIDQIKDKTQNWSQLSEKEREKIIDKNFVPRDVRKKYAEANSGRKWGKLQFILFLCFEILRNQILM